MKLTPYTTIQIKKNERFLTFLNFLDRAKYPIFQFPLVILTVIKIRRKQKQNDRSTVFETLRSSNNWPIDQLSAVPFHGVHGSIVRGRFIGGRRMCRRATAYPGASAFITRLSRLRLHVVATRWIILDMTPAYWLDGVVVSGGQQFEVD